MERRTLAIFLRAELGFLGVAVLTAVQTPLFCGAEAVSYTHLDVYKRQDVDNLLTSFYQLDDEARQEVVETIRLKLQYHRDPERAEQIKQIKGW